MSTVSIDANFEIAQVVGKYNTDSEVQSCGIGTKSMLTTLSASSRTHTPGSRCNSLVGQIHLSESCLRSYSPLSPHGYLSRLGFHPPAGTCSYFLSKAACRQLPYGLSQLTHIIWHPCCPPGLSRSEHWWPIGRQVLTTSPPRCT